MAFLCGGVVAGETGEGRDALVERGHLEIYQGGEGEIDRHREVSQGDVEEMGHLYQGGVEGTGHLADEVVTGLHR